MACCCVVPRECCCKQIWQQTPVNAASPQSHDELRASPPPLPTVSVVMDTYYFASCPAAVMGGVLCFAVAGARDLRAGDGGGGALRTAGRGRQGGPVIGGGSGRVALLLVDSPWMCVCVCAGVILGVSLSSHDATHVFSLERQHPQPPPPFRLFHRPHVSTAPPTPPP